MTGPKCSVGAQNSDSQDFFFQYLKQSGYSSAELNQGVSDPTLRSGEGNEQCSIGQPNSDALLKYRREWAEPSQQRLSGLDWFKDPKDLLAVSADEMDPRLKTALTELHSGLATALKSRKQGKLKTSERQIKKSLLLYRKTVKELGTAAEHPASYHYLGLLYLQLGQSKDLRRKNRAAQASYQKALKYLDAGIAKYPQSFSLYLVRAQTRHALGNFSGAHEDYQKAVGLRGDLEPLRQVYLQELENLAEAFAKLREQALKAKQDPKAQLYLSREIQIRGILGQEDRVSVLTPQLEQLNRRVAARRLMDSMELIGAMGFTLEGLEGDAKAFAQKFLIEQKSPKGKVTISLNEAGRSLPPERLVEGLNQVLEAQLRSQWVGLAASETDPVKKSYYGLKVDLMEGNFAAAQLKLRTIKTLTEDLDPKNPPKDQKAAKLFAEKWVIREEALGLLKKFALAAVDKLFQANEGITTQRLGNFELNYYDKQTGSANEALLKALKFYITSGKAYTLEEAGAVLHEENERLQREFAANPVIQKTWMVFYSPPRPQHGDADWKAQREDFDALVEIYNQDREDPRLRDPKAYPHLGYRKLEGGTLVARGWSEFGSRIVIGKSGGFITVGEEVFEFPPSDRERMILLKNSRLNLYGLKLGRDYHRHVNHPAQWPEGYGRVTQDYKNGHPATLQPLVDQWDKLKFRDRDLFNLIELQSKSGLEKLADPKTREETLLSAAKDLWHRNGSYAQAAEILEGLFQEDLDRALAQIPETKLQAISKKVEGERDEITKEILESLKNYQEEHPKKFAARYPDGRPSPDEFQAMVDQAVQARIAHGIRKEAFATLDGWYESGAMDGATARKAWEIFEDMEDPLDKWDNLSSQSWDRVFDEVVITAVTLPVTMGTGTLVRSGLSGTSVALRMAATGGARSLLMRGGILLTGAVTEGLVQETLTHCLFGTPWKLKNVGVTTMMSLAFHGGGRLSEGFLAKVGMDDVAIKLAKRQFRPWRHKQIGAFGVTLGTQTVVATAFTYAEDVLHPGGPQRSFTERVLGSASRMVAFHYGTKALNLATGNIALDAEMLNQARFKEAREAYRHGLERGLSKDQAMKEAVAWAKGVKWDSEENSVYYPLDDGDFEVLALETKPPKLPLSSEEELALRSEVETSVEPEITGVVDYSKVREDAILQDFFGVSSGEEEITKVARVKAPEEVTAAAKPSAKSQPMYEAKLLDLEPSGPKTSPQIRMSLRKAQAKSDVKPSSKPGHVLKGSQGGEKFGVMKFTVDGNEMQLVTDFSLSNNVYFRFAKDRGRFESVGTAAQADFEIKLTDDGNFLLVPMGDTDAKVFRVGNQWQPLAKEGEVIGDGAFYKIGKRAFRWESPEGPPDLGNLAGFKKFSEGFNRDKRELLQVVEMGSNQGEWAMDSIQPDLPHQAHIPITSAWDHPSQKQLAREFSQGVAPENLVMAGYQIRVKGRQRYADLVQKLQKHYGDRLEPVAAGPNPDGQFFLKNADGKGRIRVEIKLQTLDLTDVKTAQKKLDQFLAVDAPVLREWAGENSTRGIYAQKLLELFSGKRIQKLLNRVEQAGSAEAKERALEALTLQVGYLDDNSLMMAHHQLLHEAKALREDPRTGKVLGIEGTLELGRMIRALDANADEILFLLPQKNRSLGNPAFRDYHNLHAQLKQWVQETALVVSQMDLPAANSNWIEEPKISSERGADRGAFQDLRYFSREEIRELQLAELGVQDLEVLWQGPDHPQYGLVLVSAFNHLLRAPHGDARVDRAVVRLVSAFRHRNLMENTSVDWVEYRLGNYGRDSRGLPLSGTGKIASKETVTLSKEELSYLGLTAGQAYEPVEVVSAVRSKSSTMDVVDGVWQFIPTKAGLEILRRLMKEHGSQLKSQDPALADYLAGMLAEVRFFSPPHLEEDAASNGKMDYSRRSSRAKPSTALVEDGFQKIDPQYRLGHDLLSFNQNSPSWVGQIKGMTTAMEQSFDQGGSVIAWHDGTYQWIDLPSGANTIMTQRVDAEVYAAYQTWKKRAGFPQMDLRKGKQAWLSLQRQARDLGIHVTWGDRKSKSPNDGELSHFAGMFPYMSSLLEMVPPAVFQDPEFKGIRLHTSRVGAAQGGAYKDGYFYLYTGATQGSRRHFAGLFLHELGHVIERYYTQEGTAGVAVPVGVKTRMRQAHQTLVEGKALLGLDWYTGSSSRKAYQGSYEEFLAEMNLIYLSAGPQLRKHIRSFPEGSPERVAWEYIYGELKDRIYEGKEFSYSDAAMATDQPLELSWEQPTLRLVVNNHDSTGVQLNPFVFLLADNVPGMARRGELGDLHAGTKYGSHWASTHEGVGYKAKNEDGVVQGEDWALVLDGMGGHGEGDVASHAAGVAFYEYMNDPQHRGDMVGAFHYAHKAVVDSSGGATVAVAHRVVTKPDGSEVAQVVHVGDANLAAYDLDASGMYRRSFETQDQSWVAMLRATGRLGNTLAMRIHPQAHRVFGGLGLESAPQPVSNEIPLKPGTILISASDGFKENVSTAEILYHLNQPYKDVQELQQALMGLAMEKMSRRAIARKLLAGETQAGGSVLRYFLSASGDSITVAELDGLPGLFIDAKGTVYNSEGLVVDKYKADNISLHVYIHDKAPGGGSGTAK